MAKIFDEIGCTEFYNFRQQFSHAFFTWFSFSLTSAKNDKKAVKYHRNVILCHRFYSRKMNYGRIWIHMQHFGIRCLLDQSPPPLLNQQLSNLFIYLLRNCPICLLYRCTLKAHNNLSIYRENIHWVRQGCEGVNLYF